MYEDGVVDLPFSFMLAMQRRPQGARSTPASCRTSTVAGFSRKFGIPYWISPVRMLGELGVAPEEITDIVITHAHFDHMGSIGEFPNAQIFIQKSELLTWYEAIALPRRFGYLTAIIDPDNLRTALEASIEHRVTLVDGDKDNILPGIHVRLGPGHTLGQQFVIVETARGRLVISGDCVYSRRQVLPGTTMTASTRRSTTPPAASGISSRPSTRSTPRSAATSSNLDLLHDFDRWQGLPVVKEVDGYKIVKAS